MTFSRILIVRLSAIGDVIHTLPALHALRQAFPAAQIGWAVEDFAAAYLQGNGELDHLHIIPKKRWRGSFFQHLKPEILPWVRELRSHHYEVAIDFQGLTKSGLVAAISGAPLRIGFGDAQGAELNKLFTTKKITPKLAAAHVIERNLSLLEPLVGNSIQPPRPAIAFSDEEMAEARSILNASGGAKVIGLNVGAGWITKRWLAEHWAQLARLIFSETGMPSLLLWGNAAEKELAQRVLSLLPESQDYLKLSPPTSLRASGALIAQLHAYIGGDTGATHLAAMLGVPTVGIYGASDPVRNGPYWPNSVVVQANGLECVPCWKRTCSAREQLACLSSIRAETVLDALEKVLL